MIFLNTRLPRAILRFLLIMPVVIAGYGIHHLYVYFANPEPVEVSIEQLISHPPRAKWVRVTGGQINLMEAVSETAFNKIDSVCVPIHPEGKGKDTISVLLLSTDPELLATAQQFHYLDKAENELAGFKVAIDNIHVISQKRPFEGLIQSGLSRNDSFIFKVSKLFPNMVSKPIIIEEGKKPTILKGLGILFFAAVATAVLLVKIKVATLLKSTPPPLPAVPPSLPRNR